jgi:hypothetical protein
MNLLIKILQSLMTKKKYWLYPILFVSIIFGALMLYTQGARIAPWIYTIF